MVETWRAIPGYEGHYEVSDLGRVRSLDRMIETSQGPRFKRGVVRRPKKHTGGYLELPLSLDGQQQMFTVHKLVMLAFVGPRPPDTEVLHADDHKTNNALSNLRYGTKSENAREAIANGRNWHLNKTKCPQDHPYTPENTKLDKLGRRQCRTCAQAAVRAHYYNNPAYYQLRNERRRERAGRAAA